MGYSSNYDDAIHYVEGMRVRKGYVDGECKICDQPFAPNKLNGRPDMHEIHVRQWAGRGAQWKKVDGRKR